MDKRNSRSSDKDYLDYYHSPLAGQPHSYQLARHSRQLSTISTSSSEYSYTDDNRDTTSSDASSQASRVTRRSSVPSVGSADRRRVAIVEMDAPAEESSAAPLTSEHDPSSTLHSRRGLSSGLAIVAPPDAHHNSFLLLSPPPTAPLSSSTAPGHPPTDATSNSAHHRSASEILPHRKTRSRDVGIVGTAQLTSNAHEQGTITPKNSFDMQTNNDNTTTLHPPIIFQDPKSATPSPEPSPDPTASLAPVRGLTIMKRDKSKELPSASSSSLAPATSGVPSPQRTPEIGESKPIDVPVAPPIVVGLEGPADALPVGGIRLVTRPKLEPSAPVSASTSTPTTANVTSPPALPLTTPESSFTYVNYQPGVHSTAGPLPPPPRLPGFDGVSASPTSPPPRPPRLNSPLPPRSAARSKDLEAVKQALQLPPSVSAALSSKTPTKSRESLKNESTKPALEPKRTNGDTNAPLPAVLSVRSTSSSTMPSSPSFSESSSSSYSMVQPTSSVHRREGAFPPSSSDTGSSVLEPEPEQDTTIKRSVEHNPTTQTDAVTEQEEIPEVTIISEPPPPPSPIMEEPSKEDMDGDEIDSLRPRHRREHANGQLVAMSDNEDDSNENWVSVSRVSSPSPSSHHDRSASLDLQHNGIDRESSKTPSEAAPSPPPKSFRNSLTTGLKRFSSRSLPRTPSISSGGSRRSSSVMSKRFSTGSTHLSNGVMTPSAVAGGSNANVSAAASGVDIRRTPSPSAPSSSLPVPPRAATTLGHGTISGGSDGHASINATHGSSSAHGHAGSGVHHHQQMKRKKRQKQVVQWPSAMFCNEIHATGKKKLSSGERCSIYARKINELYMYDCGLTEWVVEMRFRGPNSNPGAGGPSKKFPEMRAPSSTPFSPQPRQTSRSSMVSDATFPVRPDATTATDLLSSSYEDSGVYHEDVPALPYPSLATAQRAAASNVAASPNLATMTPPASIRSLGSNSTLPSMGGSTTTPTLSTHTHTHTQSHSTPLHTPANTLAPLANLQAPTTPLSPTNKHLSNSSLTSPSLGGGFFASLGRKASLSSARRPNLGLGLSGLKSSPISASSSSSSGGLTSPQSSTHRLLSKPPPVSGTNKLQKSNNVANLNLSGLQMNPTTPPSGGPIGPRANNRVQRSKTYMPSASSPFSGGGGGVGSSSHHGHSGSNGNGGAGCMYGGIERRPSLWELQLNNNNATTTSLTSSGLPASPLSGSNTPTAVFSPHSYSSNGHPHGSGYSTDSHMPPHRQSQQYSAPPVQYGQPQEMAYEYDPLRDPEFVRQVDRLAELVPHADRSILAGYLRMAGEDVRAIGQYLEDEKNGTLRAF